MALIKFTPVDGLKKEDTGGAGADALTTGVDFLHDGAKTTPAWPDATNFLIHYAYGLDLGVARETSKFICYDNRDTDHFYGGRDEVEVWSSNDNVTYTFVQAYEDPTRTGGVWELVFDTPVTGRYFKVWCTSFSDGLWVDAGFWCQLVELELWGQEVFPVLKGTVQEKGANVQRIVRCYLRSSGDLYDSTTSAADGTFTLDAPDDSSEMYVVALDDDVGDQYNALIFDRVVGVFEE